MKALQFYKVGHNPIMADKNPLVGPNTMKVAYAALNHRDIWITKGLYPGIAEGVVMGADASGVYQDKKIMPYPAKNWTGGIDHQGSTFEVLGIPNDGVFADEFDMNGVDYIAVPNHLSLMEAAALPLAGITAYRALFTRGKIKKQDKVLINGIGGGVALIGAQMAIALGCEVYVLSGEDEKIQKAISLGCRGGVNYKDENWAEKIKTMTQGVDLILDGTGGPYLNKFIKIMNYGARYVFYGATLGNFQDVNPQFLFWKQISLLGSTMGSFEEYKNMISFITFHRIKPIVDSVIPFSDYSLAFEKMKNANQFGKIILEINSKLD